MRYAVAEVSPILVILSVSLIAGISFSEFSSAQSSMSLGASATNGCGYVTSCSVIVSLSSPGVIIVGCDCFPSASAGFSVSDSADLTWTVRESGLGIGGGQYLMEWAAFSSTPIINDTISISTADTNETWFGIVAFTVLGATGFDSHFPLAQANNPNCGSAPCNTGISTTGSNEFVFQIGGDTGYVTETAGSGMTFIAGTTLGQDVYVQYQIAGSPLNSQTLSFGTTNGYDNGVIVDALVSSSASSSAPTSTSTFVTTPTTASTTTASISTTSTTSASTTTSTTTAATLTSSSTCSGVQCPIQAVGKVNYALTNGGSDINNFTTALHFSSNLVGASCCISGESVGNWSLEVNTYSPAGYNAAFNQFVLTYEGNGFFIFDQEYYATSDALLFQSTRQFQAASDAVLTPESVVSLTIQTNSQGTPMNAIMSISNLTLDSYSISLSLEPSAAYNAPIVSASTVLVGYTSGESATFTSGSGTLSYEAQGGLSWQNSVPTYAQYYNAILAENSNMVYGLPTQVNSTGISQSFSY